MSFIIATIMAMIIMGFAAIPLRRAAEYRFRGQFGNTAKGLILLGFALFGFITSGIAGWLLLGGGIALGAGLLATEDSNTKFLP